MDSEYQYLTRSICMATTALNNHRVGQSLVSSKQVQKRLTAIQHIVTPLTTGTSKEDSSKATHDPNASRVIAATAAVDAKSDSVRSQVLVNQNTRYNDSKQTENLVIEAIDSEWSAEQVLDRWDEREYVLGTNFCRHNVH